jgi:hypothetical protein
MLFTGTKRHLMFAPNRWLMLAAAAVCALSAGTATAAQVRYHFTPAEICATNVLKTPATAGTRVAWFGLYRALYPGQPRATHVVTFRHPFTGANVAVPLAFPLGSPRLEYRADRIIYNYGSYSVEAHFYADGSVDTVYNSGPFRVLETNLAY